MADSNQRTNFIVRGDSAFIDIITFIEQKSIIQFLKAKRIRPSQSDITSRVLNHWENLSLIDDDRSEGKGWRMFSIVQFVWMEIIQELRKFGFPNEKILLAKEDLINGQAYRVKEAKTINDSHLLHYYIASVMCRREQVFVLVFENGEIEFANLNDLSIAGIFNSIGNHIKINLNDILQKLFPAQDLSAKDNNSMYALSQDEKELLYNIRLGNFDSVTVKLKDNEIEAFECEKSEKVSVRIVELLESGSFQDITLKQRDGKVVSVSRKAIKKANKKE